MAHSPALPGQVIRYAYLWWNEARVGREDATKDRPCGVVLTRVAKREKDKSRTTRHGIQLALSHCHTRTQAPQLPFM